MYSVWKVSAALRKQQTNCFLFCVWTKSEEKKKEKKKKKKGGKKVGVGGGGGGDHIHIRPTAYIRICFHMLFYRYI